MVGERGITSWGQKQRPRLRAPSSAIRGILILDDSLSAVDTHRGRILLTDCAES